MTELIDRRATSLRIGVVGAGAMGQTHMRIVASMPGFCLTAVADPLAPRSVTTALAAEHFENHLDMLQVAQLDGVIIATPNDLHLEVALDCIEAGVPILIEKPIAESVQAGFEIHSASAAADVPVLVGHHRRHNPIIRAAASHIQSGALGTISAVTAMAVRSKPSSYFDVEWRRHRPGGGPVLVAAIHDIDTLRLLCGEIDSVSAAMSSQVRGFEVEDAAVVLLQFTSGALGTLTVSDSARAPWTWETTARDDPRYPYEPLDCYFIGGTSSSLGIPTLEVWANDNEGGRGDPFSRRRLAYTPADAQEEQLKHFGDVIRREADPLVGCADAISSLAATLAIENAARSRSWISPAALT